METCKVCVEKAHHSCGGCGIIKYCGSKCAQKDWNTGHGRICNQYQLVQGKRERDDEQVLQDVEFSRQAGKEKVNYTASLCIPGEKGDFVASGFFGSVFYFGNGKVVKLIPVDTDVPVKVPDGVAWNEFPMDDFLQEVEDARRAADLMIGPTIFASGLCDGIEKRYRRKPKKIQIGYIVMQRLGIDLGRYKRAFPLKYEEQYDAMDKDFKVLYVLSKRANVQHGDLHTGNVVFDIDQQGNYMPGSMVFIDWTFAERPYYADLNTVFELKN